MDEQPTRHNTELTKEELQWILNFVYGSRWTGPEWQQTVSPILEKLANMIEGLPGEAS